MQTRIDAILSDYDGTLSPTDTLRGNVEFIPKQLEGILWGIAQTIPVGIVSSKDYHFIYNKAKFAWVLWVWKPLFLDSLKMLQLKSKKEVIMMMTSIVSNNDVSFLILRKY